MKLGSFYKEYRNFKKISKCDKNIIKLIKHKQKDYFLMYGETGFSLIRINAEDNAWETWVEDAYAFAYQNAKEDTEMLTIVCMCAYRFFSLVSLCTFPQISSCPFVVNSASSLWSVFFF